MSTALRQTIEAHAQKFAVALIDALRSASLDELASVTGGLAAAAPSRAPRGAKTTEAAPDGSAAVPPTTSRRRWRASSRLWPSTLTGSERSRSRRP